jgi:hypothetical protein
MAQDQGKLFDDDEPIVPAVATPPDDEWLHLFEVATAMGVTPGELIRLVRAGTSVPFWDAQRRIKYRRRWRMVPVWRKRRLENLSGNGM